MTDGTEAADPRDPDAPAALRQIAAVDRRSRATARWPAVLWLVMAIVVPLYLIGEQLSPAGPVMRVVEWSPLVAVAALLAFAATRRSESRLVARLTMPVTAAFVGLAVLCIVAKWTFLPDGYSAGLVILGALPAVPCLYAAGRVLSR